MGLRPLEIFYFTSVIDFRRQILTFVDVRSELDTRTERIYIYYSFQEICKHYFLLQRQQPRKLRKYYFKV